MPAHRIHKDKADLVIRLRNEGRSQQYISTVLSISERTVRRVLNEEEAYNKEK